jgi:thiol-disulfide isomerase/thioredoxin
VAQNKPAKKSAKKTASARRPNPRAEAKKAAERRQRLIFVIVGVAVVGLAVVIGVLSIGEGSDHVPVADVAGPVDVDGDTLPQHDANADDPAAGQPAPVVRGETFDGSPITVGEAGQAQLITFVASWCPACREELPILTDWLNEGNLPDEVDLIAVATSLDAGRPNWPPQDWFEEEGYPGPVMVDDADSTAARAYGLSGTPFWVAVDADGEVVWRSSGMVPMDQLSAIANDLAAG